MPQPTVYVLEHLDPINPHQSFTASIHATLEGAKAEASSITGDPLHWFPDEERGTSLAYSDPRDKTDTHPGECSVWRITPKVVL